MFQSKGLSRLITGLALVLLAVFFIAGCESMNYGLASSDSAGPKPAKPEPSPIYYDFDDVLIPQELKMDEKNRFVYRASGISAGCLALSGRVEVNSLVAFFENNMIKDNWAVESVVRSPRTLMLFRKENRTCVITIRSSQYSTYVDVWVAPSVGMDTGAGLLKETGLSE